MSSDNDNRLVSCIGWLVLIASAMIFSPILNGWVLSILWAWFIVPVFHLPELSIPLAIGIGLVATMLTHQYQDTDSNKKKSTSNTIAQYLTFIITPLFALFLGWIVQGFIR